MLRKTIITSLMAFLAIFAGAIVGQAQSIERDNEYGEVDYERVKIDRHLDVEVWTDHYDGEYYSGDNIVVYFRASRDAFVSIYSIDTRGRVNLLFPADPTEDNYVRGGVTYSLPGEDADYDLEINGPEGFENIQIVASRERFAVPNWYRNSGLVCDWDDRAEYMDFLNANHFVRYSGQRFAYDRAVIYVNEWEQDYYRPVYRPYYPSWTVYGNAYIDYPFGSSIYVNGIYWGCAPLYVPRISVGWHVVTIYDHYGHCWESDFHVSRYNTVVFDRAVIRTSSTVKSKYKEVRLAGYRDPVKSGYPNFKSKTVINNNVTVNNTKVVNKSTSKTTVKNNTVVSNAARKYVRGSTKMVKTDRGYETDASSAVVGTKTTKTRTGSTSRTQTSVTRTTTGSSSKSTGTKSSKTNSGSYKNTSGNKSSSSSGYYQKKSGSSSKRSSSVKSSSKSGSSSNTVKSQSKSSSSSKSSGTSSSKSGSKSSYKKQSSSNKSSGTVKSTPKKSTKSSSTKSSSGSKVKSSSPKKSGGSSKATESSSGSKSSSSKKKDRK
ncbi:MAG: DUF4384 domain-containing protein [bacterium]|nr:DUF4384 domain-containing protein [bacterium]